MRAIFALVVGLLVAPAASAQSAAEVELVHAWLSEVNPQSIARGQEVCGFLLRAPSGEIGIGKPGWGGPVSCAMGQVPEGHSVVASWHTHSAFTPGYDGEVPSTLDVETGMAQGRNGWVATPGGRLWFVDGDTGFLYQVCGRSCLPADPGFIPERYGPVAESYSLGALRRRFAANLGLAIQ
ncbi:MAG: hypothetical protein COW55_08650 [Rhodobacteraceae bacterium CG17_big_fil_post_rev_8_21_14_2_50_65_11]|nr:MAG: hypothetical protein COW55_08650 [Rhodobacteraceae bacterium CG17_big_fil_post_rev_8_21_14_2_50_65_11]